MLISAATPIKGLHRLADSLDVLLRHALIRQPGGFEGVAALALRPAPHEPPPKLSGLEI
jgi:hypothetical protein